MITLTTEQAQQIEEIVEHLLVEHPTARHHKACVDALSIIRAARAQEQAEQEPVHWVVPDFGFLFPSEDAAQRYLINIESDAKPTPCYAAPPSVEAMRIETLDNVVNLVERFISGDGLAEPFISDIVDAIRRMK